MKISYKPLWKLLIDKDMTKKDLQERTGLGSSTFTKLKNNDCVRTDTLVKICEVLNCQLSEIAECVEEQNVKISNSV
jgi:conserved domain protein|nr:MAG TPA: Cro/C1-type HTH DNA-binding domain protein [Caudoviricetes sp.]